MVSENKQLSCLEALSEMSSIEIKKNKAIFLQPPGQSFPDVSSK